MAKLTQEMKDMITTQQCWVATVNQDGAPNIGPKRSTRVIDDEHIAYNEATARQTWGNVSRGSKVAIGCVDSEKTKGFRFLGTPQIVTSGPLFDQAVERNKKAGRPTPRAVIKVTVERIFQLGSDKAGEEVK